MRTRLGQWVSTHVWIAVLALLFAVPAMAAPYAAMVMDARSGEVLHSRNADTRLHPASLTKMMTLYVVFEAIKNGEITADTVVTISRKAASEQPSKLGLRPGQRIKLRYLIRAAAVKSANDAATALAEAISDSEAAFARRMNRTAKALGMSRTTFKNAHGLTEAGHLSTARDMTILGRHLFYDYPEYYNLFSRRSTDAGVKEVANTNRRFLGAYRGADGIKTGYTRAAGFNLVASAERGQERIIATMFGGRSTAQRNAKVAELLDMGFARAPSRVALRRPTPPPYGGSDDGGPDDPVTAGKIIRVVRAVTVSPRPVPRPSPEIEEPAEELLVAMQQTIEEAVTAVHVATAEPSEDAPTPTTRPEAEIAAETETETVAEPTETVTAEATTEATPVRVSVAPQPRPETVALRVVEEPVREVVTRLSTSGGRHWGINIGRYRTRNEAERMLLRTALAELGTLDEALRKVASSSQGHDANFVGMTEEGAALACRRLLARSMPCRTLGPT